MMTRKSKIPIKIIFISIFLFFSALITLFMSDWQNASIFGTIISLIYIIASLVLGINLLRLLNWARIGTIILMFCFIASKIFEIISSINSNVEYNSMSIFFLVISSFIIEYLFKQKDLDKIKK